MLLLECTHGMLSQNFKTVEAAARQRAERAMRRLADERRHRMGLVASQAQPVDAANVPLQVMQAQVASDLADEAAQRSRDVLEYLLDPAAVPRMVRMRLVLESAGHAGWLPRCCGESDEDLTFQLRASVSRGGK